MPALRERMEARRRERLWREALGHGHVAAVAVVRLAVRLACVLLHLLATTALVQPERNTD